MNYPRRRIPPLTACVICRGNSVRTWSKSYQCDACLAEVGLTREPSAASVDERRTVFVTDEPRMPPLSRRHINSWLVEHEGYTFERITEDGRVFQRLLVVDKCPTCKQSTRMIAGPWRDLWGDLP